MADLSLGDAAPLPLGDATLIAAAEADFAVSAGPRSGSLASSLAVGQEILLAALRALGERLDEAMSESRDAAAGGAVDAPHSRSHAQAEIAPTTAPASGRESVASQAVGAQSPAGQSPAGQSPLDEPAGVAPTGAERHRTSPGVEASATPGTRRGPAARWKTQQSGGHSRFVEGWTEIHLLLVGGAAGMLSGLLDPERTTTDCDVMLYHPVEAGEFVEALASDLAGEFGLSERWLNRGGAPWAEAMPAGWESRRVLVLSQGPLRVHAVGRLDLIALKLVAGRAQDIEDLETMAITPQEFATLRSHFEGWTDDSWPTGVIAGALELLDILADAGAGWAAATPGADAEIEPPGAMGASGPDADRGASIAADAAAASRRAERVRRFLDGQDVMPPRGSGLGGSAAGDASDSGSHAGPRVAGTKASEPRTDEGNLDRPRLGGIGEP